MSTLQPYSCWFAVDEQKTKKEQETLRATEVSAAFDE